MFVRWQTKLNRKGEEILYAALCSTDWVERKAKSRYLGALGNIAVGDISYKSHREVFWRGVQSRLVELGVEKDQLVKVEEAIAQRVPRPGDKRIPQHSTGNDEWYTPPEWTDRARDVMGGIDLDPATTPKAQSWIQATTYYTANEDGLSKPWGGRVWLNPPYSKTKPWVIKAIAEYDARNITEAIILVKSASDTSWFSLLAERFCRAERRGRMEFIDREGKPGSSPAHGNTFFYLGDNPERFRSVFKAAGCITASPD